MTRSYFRHFILTTCCIACFFNSFCHKQDSLSVNHLEFIANKGQWESSVVFKAKLNGGAFFAETDRTTFVFLDGEQLSRFNETKFAPTQQCNPMINAAYYQAVFKDCNHNAVLSGNDKVTQHHNYFIGNDEKKWSSNVPIFQEIKYQNLYNGIDLVYYHKNQHLKYEFLIAPQADYRQIQIDYIGVKSISLNHGNLILKTSVGQVVEMAPFAYQIDDKGDTTRIACQFSLRNHILSYEIAKYDKTKKLIIDPELVFSSYSGSAADNWGFTATYDKHGNLYGGGIAFDIGYPVNVDYSYQINYGGGSCDVAISKFDSSGSTLLYSTYLGGTSAECPHSMFVNDNDELYVFGTTSSYTFPVTRGAYDTTFNGGTGITLNGTITYNHGADIFISKFSSDGNNLVGSTFIGGNSNDGLNIGLPLKKNYADESRGEIVIDKQSNVYIASCTFSEDFPVSDNCFQPIFNNAKEGCVFKMDQNLTHLIWSSFIGSTGDDACYSLDVATDNSVFLCGGTNSTNFPVSTNATQAFYGGGECDGFVAHISENGNELLDLTYLGKENYDQCYLIKLSHNDHPYLFGQTNTPDNRWLINTMYGQSGGGQFLTHLTPTLDSIVWSTAFGTGNGIDISPTALLVDLCNTVYMSGWGSYSLNGFGGTNGLPITPDAYQNTTDGSDYYFICLREDGTSPVYASFFGSPYSREHVDGGTSRFDRKGRIYQAICAGCGGDDNFPTTPGAWSETNESSNCNLGVVKMDFKLPVIIADFTSPNIICYPDSVSFVNNSQTQSPHTNFYWDFGDGTHSTTLNPSHLYSHGGLYHATLYISDTNSCNLTDSFSKDILVLTGGMQTLADKAICNGDFTQIGIAPSGDEEVHYHWTPENSLSNPFISNPIATPSATTTYQLVINTPYCSDTILQTVSVEDLQISDIFDSVICLGSSILLHFDILSGNPSHIIWSLSPDFSEPLAENVQQIEVSPSTNTHYYLKVDGNLCSIEKDITVSVSSISISGTDPRKICFEDSICLSVTAEGGNTINFQWEPASEISSGQGTNSPWVNPSSSTTYIVTAVNEYGCTASASIPVTKRTGTFAQGFEAWCETCNIIEGSSTRLFSTTYDGTYTYQWEPSNSVTSPTLANTNANPTETTTYTVSISDKFGCYLSKDVLITVTPLTCDEPLVFVPNSFTPNGDGKNDILFVRSSILKEFTLKIYNRWGEQIFETSDLSHGWDGSFNGKMCEQGVYDYYLIGTCINDETISKKGNITIIY